LAEVPRSARGEEGVVFVDDNTLIATADTFPQTHTKINRMMDRRGGVNEWGRTHNAKFGPAKYQVAGFSRCRIPAPFLPGKTLPEPRCHLHLSDGHVVKTSKTVKLLGVHLDRELRWHEQSAAAIAKGEAWLIQTGRIARASRGIGARDM
jgi:hypothetical protein